MPKIEELYAWICEDNGPDDEGVCAYLGPEGKWMPMVGADLTRMEALRVMAHVTASTTGKPVRLVRFGVRTDMERITANPKS